jgi:hypothetical protein
MESFLINICSFCVAILIWSLQRRPLTDKIILIESSTSNSCKWFVNASYQSPAVFRLTHEKTEKRTSFKSPTKKLPICGLLTLYPSLETVSWRHQTISLTSVFLLQFNTCFENVANVVWFHERNPGIPDLFPQSRNPGIGWLQSRDFGIDNLVHFYLMITVSSSILATAN